MSDRLENLQASATIDQPPVEAPGAVSDQLAATEEEIRELIDQQRSFLFCLLQSVLPHEYRPNSDRVLVQPLVPDDHLLQNGLWRINQASKHETAKALVVAVGPGLFSTKTGRRIPIEVSPGDVVVYSKHSGSTVTLGGYHFLALKESDILLKIA